MGMEEAETEQTALRCQVAVAGAVVVGGCWGERAVLGDSQISGLGRSHYVRRDLEEEQIWKKDDKRNLEEGEPESLRPIQVERSAGHEVGSWHPG